MSRIPIWYCGAHPDLCKKISKLISAKYEVVYMVHTLQDGLRELPPLLDIAKVGQTPSELPKAVAVGGALTEDDMLAMKAACDPLRRLPWFKKVPQGPAPPSAETLAEEITAKLDKEFQNHDPEPGVYYW